jgi:hypothetical protein
MAYVADETDATTAPGGKRSLWWELEKGEGFFAQSIEHRARVEVYVCTECGFFEEYVVSPGNVEWTKLTPFSWHRPPQPPPAGYRSPPR